MFSPKGGFCLERLAKSAPRSLLVNRFAVLDIEEVNTDIREPIDTPPFSLSAPDRTVQPQKPKWEKRLPKRLSVNILDACGVTPYKRLGKISDILHLNNKNNQLERRVWPPKDIH